VVFTSPGERRAEALDLRRQIRSVSDEAPKSNSSNGSEHADSIALTQDGIPVSAEISVTFMLDPGHRDIPREGGDPRLPPYEFSRAAAERAVYGHVYSEVEDVPWTRLPLILVIDTWRDLVKARPLEALLTIEGEAMNPLERLQRDIMERLNRPSAGPANELSPEQPISREAEILYSRGIRLLEVKISNLQLPSEIQSERNLQWRERWGGNLAAAKARAVENVRAESRLGETMADTFMLSELSHNLREKLQSDRKPGRRDTLMAIYSDALNLSQQSSIDPEGHTSKRLGECLNSIGSLDPDCASPSAEELQ
jgi:hypothetical protein